MDVPGSVPATAVVVPFQASRDVTGDADAVPVRGRFAAEDVDETLAEAVHDPKKRKLQAGFWRVFHTRNARRRNG